MHMGRNPNTPPVAKHSIIGTNSMDCLLVMIHKCSGVLVLVQCSSFLIYIPNHLIRDAVLLSKLLVCIIEV